MAGASLSRPTKTDLYVWYVLYIWTTTDTSTRKGKSMKTRTYEQIKQAVAKEYSERITRLKEKSKKSNLTMKQCDDILDQISALKGAFHSVVNCIDHGHEWTHDGITAEIVYQFPYRQFQPASAIPSLELTKTCRLCQYEQKQTFKLTNFGFKRAVLNFINSK